MNFLNHLLKQTGLRFITFPASFPRGTLHIIKTSLSFSSASSRKSLVISISFSIAKTHSLLTGIGALFLRPLCCTHSIVYPLIGCGLMQSIRSFKRSPIRIPVDCKIIMPYFRYGFSSVLRASFICATTSPGMKSIFNLRLTPVYSFPVKISVIGTSSGLCN